MDRRAVLAGAAGALGFGGGYYVLNDDDSVCGPGDDEMGSYGHSDEGVQVSFVGEVLRVNEVKETFTIDDRTGFAQAGGPPLPDVGQCMRVEGPISRCIGRGCDDSVLWIDPAAYEPA